MRLYAPPAPTPTSSLTVLLGEEGPALCPPRVLPGTAPSPAAGLREGQEGGPPALQERAGAGTKERGAEEDVEPRRETQRGLQAQPPALGTRGLARGPREEPALGSSDPGVR